MKVISQALVFAAFFTAACGGEAGDRPDIANDAGTSSDAGEGPITDGAAEDAGTATDAGSITDAHAADTASTVDAGDHDTVPPIALAISPEDGAVGLLADAEIVVTFSEPMDRTTTEAAYVSADLPASDVSFGWNATSDELTITPDGDLAYAEGSDDSVVARAYTFAIVTSATDIAGNALAEAVNATFSTARRIVVEIPTNDTLSGTRVEGGGASTGFIVGDLSLVSERWYRVVVSFDLAALPSDVLVWNAVTLESDQTEIFGRPYSRLGDLHVHDVELSAPTDMQAAAASPGPDLGVLSTDDTLERKSVDVQAAVLADLGGPRTQFVLRFSTDHSGDSASDSARFDQAATLLRADFLIE